MPFGAKQALELDRKRILQIMMILMRRQTAYIFSAVSMESRGA